VLLRRLIPQADAAFFKTWELQAREALHAHFLLRLQGVYLPEAVIQRLLVRAGFGYILKVKTADAGTARYLTKYLTKDLAGAPCRVWSWSLNWAHWGPPDRPPASDEWQPKRRRNPLERSAWFLHGRPPPTPTR
jgi:hypothetical protein